MKRYLLPGFMLGDADFTANVYNSTPKTPNSHFVLVMRFLVEASLFSRSGVLRVE
jgi:hypothetical protein